MIIEHGFNLKRLPGGDVLITFDKWQLAIFYRIKGQILMLDRNAPDELSRKSIQILMDKYPKWQTCTYV